MRLIFQFSDWWLSTKFLVHFDNRRSSYWFLIHSWNKQLHLSYFISMKIFIVSTVTHWIEPQGITNLFAISCKHSLEFSECSRSKCDSRVKKLIFPPAVTRENMEKVYNIVITAIATIKLCCSCLFVKSKFIKFSPLYWTATFPSSFFAY